MNIKEFAAKPKLTELKITDPDIVEKYGEEITFFTYDVVGMSTYFDFFDARQKENFTNLGKESYGYVSKRNTELKHLTLDPGNSSPI